MRGSGASRLYVDDLITTGTDAQGIAKFKRETKSSFKIHNFGLLSFYLGIMLNQFAYALKILEKAV